MSAVSRLVFLTLALTLVTAVTVSVQSHADWRQPASADWPLAGGDWLNSRYTALRQITPGNVTSLRGAWVTELGPDSSRAAPVVQDGVIFLPAGLHLLALDGKTGAVRWRYQAERGAFSPQGLAIGEGLVFSGVGERIVAVKQDAGSLVWSYSPSDTPTQAITGPPVYVSGVVIAGVSQGDSYLRGRVVGLDAKTGRELWRFTVVPGPGETGHETWPSGNDSWKYGGGAVWMVPAVDPDLGLVYFGTGNPVPQWGGEIRAGDNLYTEAIIAVDIRTGKLRWYRQLIHHDIWEMDFSTPMVLYDAVVDGRVRKALAAARADGYLFLLDRATGKPVFPIEERPVPQDAFLKTSPTQPFPVGADKIGPASVTSDMVPPGFDLGGYFRPLRVDMPNYVMPAPAVRFAPLSYSPETRFIYAAGCVNQWWYRRAPSPWFFTNSYSRIPGAKRWGLITAFDSRTNKIAWEQRVPYPICGGGGTMVTATGLLFHHEPDGDAQAYDARTGKLLWLFQTGTLPPVGPIGPYGGAMVSYTVGGEQYVAFANGRVFWAFSLGGPLEPRPAPPARPTEEPFAGSPVDTTTIQSGLTVSQEIAHMKYRETWKYEWAVEPERARIKVGAKVTWTNTGTVPHTFGARDRSWTTGPIQPGGTGSATFQIPGRYIYICQDHPWTIGELIVE